MGKITFKRCISLSACLLLACLTACSYTSGAKDAVWLHGAWVLTHNPEKDSADKLLFKDDGTVVVQTEDGREIPGKYLIEDNQLKMTLATSRDVVDVEFTISADKSKLIYRNGAFYTKQK